MENYFIHLLNLQFYSAFLKCEDIDRSLVPEDWFENHFKWIMWKLASYERHFPEHFANKLDFK